MTTLTRFEDFTTPETRSKIVNSLFGSIGRLSRPTRVSILQQVGQIKGFRPGKVPNSRLKVECNNLARKSTDFFRHVIMPAWVEVHPDLEKRVTLLIRESPPPADATEKALVEHLVTLSDSLAKQDERYISEDYLAMFQYCAALHPDQFLRSELDSSEKESLHTSEIGMGMAQFLQWLSSLPADADEWATIVPGFTSLLEDIVSQKKKESSNVSELSSALSNVKSTHTDTLDFLQADTSSWSPSNVAGVDTKDILSQQADSLHQALEEYSEAIKIAGTIAEERKRREKRVSLEKAIESRIKKINALLDEAEPPNEDQSFVSLQDFIGEPTEPVSTVAPDGVVATQVSPLSPAEEAVHASGIHSLEERTVGLEEEIQDLESQVRRLGREVTLWRNSYETERQSRDDSEPEPIPAEFANVTHVLEVAEKRFGDKLLFNFNAASDKDSPYDNPADVWNAVEWLATTYYDARDGSGSEATFDESLRKVSRFHYKPHQSVTTIGMYPDSYYTRINGKKILLKEHIGAGKDRNPTHTIRIAFNWDKPSRKVIVGYIGLHQKNSKT